MPTAKKRTAKVRPNRRGEMKMSAHHKAALAAGRDDARAVKAYLEALESVQPRGRGRQRSAEATRRRLTEIEKSMPTVSALIRLQFVQERADLTRELAARQGLDPVQLKRLRAAFVKVAKGYGERKGISYGTWRAVGVDAATLRDAGILRSEQSTE